MLELSVNTNPSYTIYIKEGLLTDQIVIDVCRTMAQRWVIISDDQVASYYGEQLKTHLNSALDCELLTFKSGDINKTRTVKAALEDQMFALGYGRDTGMIALGGGVVTDMAGFIAATYNRGIPVIYMPSSLLGIVDACIGGKTAVNTNYGKNLIGVFNQPIAVYVDLNMLATLNSKNYIDGLVELFKHALIADRKFWDYLREIHYDSLFQLDYPSLTKIIYRSMEIKANIVTCDVREKGQRQLLNFGHTIGHALETASDYQISHGQAVAFGMITESYMSYLLGLMCENTFTQIEKTLVSLIDKSLACFNLNEKQLIKHLKYDKKASNQQPHFVLLNDIAQPYINQAHYAHTVADDVIAESITCLLQNKVYT